VVNTYKDKEKRVDMAAVRQREV